MASKEYVCGYCDNKVASIFGYFDESNPTHFIYICPHCECASFFSPGQCPCVLPGEHVASLPKDIEALYREARESAAASAYTGAAMICRKLLMNIAVAQGADVDKSFVEYVEYLCTKGYIPPDGKGWVDHIREKGNEANHEICIMTKEDANELIVFTGMLLKFIYEFPSRIRKSKP
jgi:hypothetical protein